jgi:lipoyl(octanoyl) transferase
MNVTPAAAVRSSSRGLPPQVQLESGRACVWEELGRVGYREAWDRQLEQVERLKQGAEADRRLFVEHPHVVTLGRNARMENLLVSPERMAELGIELHETDRGGDVTYHGPGQLVGYPVVNLAPDRKDVWKYVRDLEEALIRTAAGYGVTAQRKPGLTGVWVGEEKLAAIGVRISRWVTTHGFALNVTTDLTHFRTIVPCGIRDHGVTSLQRLMPRPPSLPETGSRFAGHFADIFGRTLEWSESACPA